MKRAKQKVLSLVLALVMCLGLTIPALALPPFTTMEDMYQYVADNVSLERQGAQAGYDDSVWLADDTIRCGNEGFGPADCNYSVVSMDTAWTVTNNDTSGAYLGIHVRPWNSGSSSYRESTSLIYWYDGKWNRFTNRDDGQVAPSGGTASFSVADIIAAEKEYYSYEMGEGSIFELSFELVDLETMTVFSDPYDANTRFLKIDSAAVANILAQNPTGTPSTPTTPSTPAQAANVVLSPQDLVVEGKYVDCEKYNIDGANYFKLRDLAYLLNGTDSQFSVGYDATTSTVTIDTGMSYTPNGTELVTGVDNSGSAERSNQTILINGVARSDLSVYNIGGSNFFQLRELGNTLGFLVGYLEASNTAFVMSPTRNGQDIYGGYGSYEGYLAHYREMYPKASEEWLRRNFPDPLYSHEGKATEGDKQAGLLG